MDEVDFFSHIHTFSCVVWPSDLLYKDYSYDQKLSISSTTKTGIVSQSTMYDVHEFESGQSQSSPKNPNATVCVSITPCDRHYLCVESAIT